MSHQRKKQSLRVPYFHIESRLDLNFKDIVYKDTKTNEILFIVTQDDYDLLSKLEIEKIKGISDSEAIQVFPEAKGYVNKRKKEIASEIRELIILGNQIKDTCLKIKDLKERELAEELFMELKVNLPIKTLEDELKRLNKMTDVQYIKDNLDKVKAKNRPISDFIDFNNAGFSKCLWHSEKTGSMKYYQKDNHVHCFSCNKSADSIEVVMKLKGCTFKEALSILN